MFYSILRVHNQAIFEKHMIRIFGEIPDTNGMTPLEREEYLLDLYRTHLKKAQPDIKNKKSRSAYVKILDPYKDRTKYDLVYLTRHPLGIKVFMEASEKLDLVQKFVRAKVKQKRRIDKSRQMELFSAGINIANEDKVNLSDVKKYWLSKLSYESRRFGDEELADMLEETGWFISDFQKAFNELISEGKVKNLDASRKRPVHAIHFDKKELLRKVDP
jgi:GMT-like wHTH domain